jgi:predicted TIM-barrel fold metal-dependent hydrolase
MITDVHTHYWTPEHMGPPWTEGIGRVSAQFAADHPDRVTVESYREGLGPAARSIVFGLQAAAAGMHVPNDEIAEFVGAVGGQTVGFMSVDPVRHDAVDEIERCVAELGLQGIKLGPIYQGTSALNPLTTRVFARAERLGLPIMIHQGAIFPNAGRLADANPLMIDDVAIAFPDLRIVIAHMGHPWVHETAVVMRRHPNVFADTSAVARRPTMLATALTAAKEYGVLPKVLFGSDSPMVTAQHAATALRQVVARMAEHGHTAITDDELHELLHRPTFDLLQITPPPAAAAPSPAPARMRGTAR